MKNTYNFPVEFRPICTVAENPTRSKIVQGKQAVVRMDSLEPIAVVSKKYTLLPHAEVVEGFRKALKGQTVEEKIELTHNGARLHLEFRMPEIKIKIDRTDEMMMRLIVQNSYDGSHKLQIAFGAFRLVCSNGMVIGKKIVSFSRRHIGIIGLEVEKVQEQVVSLTELFKNSAPQMQEMSRKKLTIVPEKFFNQQHLQLPKYLTQVANEEFQNSNGSIWDAYNALTFAITHKMKKENPNASIAFGQRAWEAVAKLF